MTRRDFLMTPVVLAAADTRSDAAPLPVAPAVPHPTVFLTPDDVRRARQNAARFPWAKAEYDAICAEAETWVKRPDDWYRRFLPEKDACYAYGFTGCPICGAATGYWWNANASFDLPDKVTCANGHVLPDADHPDTGTGYVAPDGRIHYLVGSFHAWVIERFVFGALNSLAYAWTLTGNAAYAEKGAFLLDAIAAIYPHSTRGSWDYPSNPPSGRLNRPWYQVARMLVHFTDQYDQLFHAPALDKPSVVPGLSRRRNIEANLLRNGAKYCRDHYKGLNTLNNGAADYIRGAMIVGVCLGIPEYIAPAVAGPLGILSLLENNIDRDGKYFETSANYAEHSRELYLTFAEPLHNCRTAPYPTGYDVYRHPRLQSLLTLHNLGQALLGQRPRYGDSGPQSGFVPIPDRPFDDADFRCLEMLHTRLPESAAKTGAGSILNWLAGGDVRRLRAAAPALPSITGGGFAHRTWLLFHAGDVPDVSTKPDRALLQTLTGSVLFGQKGMAILRRGENKAQQALLLRYGPSLNHGHRDDLNINFSAHGYECTYDLGYGLATTHTQVGFAKLTASHNLVVVDETTQNEPTGATGGSLHLFASLPGVEVAEASSENSYRAQGVDLYRRTVALIDGCLLDIFRVRGGRQHDCLFHSLGDDLTVSGVTLGPEQAGSLAGKEIDWCAAQLNDGDMAGHPNKPGWNPPPGNGYGFLSRPRFGRATAPFTAEWRLPPGADQTAPPVRFRLTVAPEPDTEVLTAWAPGIVSALPKIRVLGARRRGETGLTSAFVAVAEPTTGSPRVTAVERLTVTGTDKDTAPPDFAPVAVRIRRGADVEDIVYSAADASPSRIDGARGTVAARFACARLEKGKLAAVYLVGGTAFTWGTDHCQAPTAGWSGTVTALEDAAATVTVDVALPTDGSLTGSVIAFSNPKWNRNTAYTLHSVESDGKTSRLRVHGTFDLGRGVVAAVPDATTLLCSIPHEFARPVRRGSDSGFFTGKMIRAASGAQTRVTAMEPTAPLPVRVESSAGFRPGETFRYCDVTEGDRFEILAAATLTPIPTPP